MRNCAGLKQPHDTEELDHGHGFVPLRAERDGYEVRSHDDQPDQRRHRKGPE